MPPMAEQLHETSGRMEKDQVLLSDIYRALARHFAGAAEAYKQLQKHEEMKRTHA
jgi:hypothetical protein